MKVLVAAVGVEPDDFSYTVPGELVMEGITCDRDRIGDGECGCSRAWVGLSSHKSTTLARVVERDDLDLEMLASLIADGLTSAGWAKYTDVAVWAGESAEDLAELAGEFDAGALVRRDLDTVTAA